MAGLQHSFFLVRRTEFSPVDHLRFAALPGDIELHDDVIRYMDDTLRWLPAYNPARRQDCEGLCLYGSTVVWAHGARVAAQIFSAWERLFSLGPAELELTGAYAWEEDPEAGRYEKLRFERDELCARLRALVTLCETVVREEGEFFLLHSGI